MRSRNSGATVEQKLEKKRRKILFSSKSGRKKRKEKSKKVGIFSEILRVSHPPFFSFCFLFWAIQQEKKN